MYSEERTEAGDRFRLVLLMCIPLGAIPIALGITWLMENHVLQAGHNTVLSIGMIMLGLP
ncbi:hypothetical protein [Neptuniibacter sp. QD37_11]|uniref:hypothetical protein n=1 Tax=Neptuniibacter sp. QD37_11 TaxID=3398209 RepID=UPI0039F5B45F